MLLSANFLLTFKYTGIKLGYRHGEESLKHN